MTRARLMTLLCSVAFMGVACGTSSTPSPTPSAPPAVHDEADEVDRPIEDEPTIPAVSDTELDAMDRGELEMLCDQGSTAACDRLGH